MSEKVCTYCGQAGHRAHACRRRVIAEAADATRVSWIVPAVTFIATLAGSAIVAWSRG